MKKKKKILIVDDQREVRELVEVTLSMEDYKIFQAENGEEAVHLAKEEKPDLIIMDVMMPGAIDGLEATQILKSHQETKDCQVLMLSAKGQQYDRDKGLQMGADYYFIKPFSPLELIMKVEKVLG